MADPFGALLLTEMLKKIVGIFGDRAKDRLFADKDPRLKELVGLHNELRALELALVQLADIIDSLIEKPSGTAATDEELIFVLESARRSLGACSTHLRALSPGLEIMSDDVVPKVTEFHDGETELVYALGLVPDRGHGRSAESLNDYRDRMTGLREQADAARKSIAAFIRSAYTWKELAQIYGAGNRGEQHGGYRVIIRE